MSRQCTSCPALSVPPTAAADSRWLSFAASQPSHLLATSITAGGVPMRGRCRKRSMPEVCSVGALRCTCLDCGRPYHVRATCRTARRLIIRRWLQQRFIFDPTAIQHRIVVEWPSNRSRIVLKALFTAADLSATNLTYKSVPHVGRKITVADVKTLA